MTSIRLSSSGYLPQEERLIQGKMNNNDYHLLRMLSALSISSSRVVFTDRLRGERSLSVAWPVILTHLQADRRTGFGEFRVCSDSVYGAYDRSIARGTSWGRGTTGMACHNGSPEHHAAVGCCGDRSKLAQFWIQLCELLSYQLQLPSSCTCDMWHEWYAPTRSPADAWRDV